MLPDLSLLGMSITQNSPNNADVSFDIYNTGTAPINQLFGVYVCITALCKEQLVNQPIPVGGRINVTVSLPHPASSTPETVAVAVNSRGEILELREDNNTTSLSNVSLSF